MPLHLLRTNTAAMAVKAVACSPIRPHAQARHVSNFDTYDHAARALAEYASLNAHILAQKAELAIEHVGRRAFF